MENCVSFFKDSFSFRSYCAQMDTLHSSSSNVGVKALSLRESLKKKNIAYFCPHFGKFNFRAKLYSLSITIGAKSLHIWRPRGILNRNLFLVYPWPYIKYANIYDTPKCFFFCGFQLDGIFFYFFYFYFFSPDKVYADVINGLQ